MYTVLYPHCHPYSPLPPLPLSLILPCRDEDAPAKIPDVDVEKPEGWLDDGPEFIPDPESSKPEDWYVHKSLSNEGTGVKGEGGVLGSAPRAVLLVVCMTRLLCIRVGCVSAIQG